jgi:Flp pilus assembly protein TadG
MVEFALTGPVLVLLFLGLVEFGYGLNSYLTVIATARDAARLGAQGDVADNDLLSVAAAESARLPTTLPTGSQNCGGAGVCIDHFNLSNPTSAPAIRVTVCYDHPLIVGIPGILDGDLAMCSSTTMRVKGDDSG